MKRDIKVLLCDKDLARHRSVLEACRGLRRCRLHACAWPLLCMGSQVWPWAPVSRPATPRNSHAGP